MRIVYIANVRFPTERAHGIQIAKVCEALGHAGQDIELVVPSRNNSVAEDAFAFYGIDRVFKIKYVPMPSFIYQPLGFFFGTFLFLHKAKRYLRTVSDSHIYSRDLFAPLFFSDAIVEVHDLPKSSFRLYRRAFTRAKACIVKTSFIGKELISRFGIDKSRITVLPNGIDIKEFSLDVSQKEVREKLKLPPSGRIALYAGSFYGWKGLDIFLSVAHLAKDIQFVVVGGSESEIKEMQARFSDENIIFVGRKSHKEIPSYLRAADVLVLPNKKGEEVSEKYTSPLKLFEYMSSGTPIVVSGLPSIEEIVSTNEVYFFEANDASDCARAIQNVFQHQDEARKKAMEARKIAEGFSWTRYASIILDLMKQ